MINAIMRQINLRISRLNRRERIETNAITIRNTISARISRLNRRERIETYKKRHNPHWSNVSPGLTAGSGLKHYAASTR